jgi:choline dehydrogenase-like flavoprotein
MLFDSLLPDPRRAALAIAEAIIPGSGSVPAADEASLDGAEALVAEFHPTLLKAWRAAHQALDASTLALRGRPFHALSAAAQEEMLHRWERDPILRAPLGVIAMIHKLVHFDRTPVYEALGGSRSAAVNIDRPAWLSQIHRAAEWTEGDIECDVVVVGTGAGGAVVGKELADRGHAVVFVEEGEHYRRDAFDGSSVSAHRRFYRGAFAVGNVTIPLFIGRMFGGSTAINGGTCFRTPSWVLERWCDDLGTDDFSVSSMDPMFAKVERFLDVAPSGMAEIGRIGDIMARGCDALGWSHFPIPRNAPGCNGKGFCNFGCKTDARKGTNLSYMPAALTKGAVALTGGRVDRVLLEGTRAVGVVAVAGGGRTVTVRARAVILAGGAIPTPLLMMKQGLGDAGGQVGRNLALHPSCGYTAIFDEEVRGREHVPQGYACDEFLRDGILLSSAQPDVNFYGMISPFLGRQLMDHVEGMDRTAGFAALVRDDAPNGRVWRDVGGLPAITYTVTQTDADNMHSAMVHGAELAFAAGAKRVCPVVVGTPIVERGSSLEAFRDARLTPGRFIWSSFHPLGTCRMGPSAKTSVVDLSHEVHGVRGLYVVDGSTLPSPLGVNPQLTIMAVATRAGAKIHERLSAA